MKQGLQEITYIKPYAQEALGGRLGLTSVDIAATLAVQHRDLVRDLRERQYAEFLKVAGFEFAEISANRKGPGRKGKMFVLDVEAAKAIVASSRTEVGAGYLRYLLTCEKIAEQLAPRLAAELEAAHATIAKLTEPQQRRIPGKGIVSVIVRTLRVVDLFGEIHEEIHRERKLYSELSEAEKRRYKLGQRAAVMRGIAALQDDDLNPKTPLN